MGRSTGISPDQRRTLDCLSQLRPLRGFYLAGGTAIAAHLAHRRSLDLDLFSVSRRADLIAPQRAIVDGIDGATVLESTEVTVRLLVGAGPIDLVRYPYPLLEPPIAGPGGFPMAGLRDLAAMKLAAVSRRGIRRDFWDLHVLATRGGISLSTAARAYVERFGVAEADLYAVLRALTYFDDAEAETLWPAGLSTRAWTTIRLLQGGGTAIARSTPTDPQAEGGTAVTAQALRRPRWTNRTFTSTRSPTGRSRATRRRCARCSRGCPTR